jgi:hypothetical protein
MVSLPDFLGTQSNGLDLQPARELFRRYQEKIRTLRRAQILSLKHPGRTFDRKEKPRSITEVDGRACWRVSAATAAGTSERLCGRH